MNRPKHNREGAGGSSPQRLSGAAPGRDQRGPVASWRTRRRAEQARAPYASNWRTVLLVDAALGAAAFVAGVVVVFAASIWIGAGIGALGAVYVALVVRRYRLWAELRGDAGLDP